MGWEWTRGEKKERKGKPKKGSGPGLDWPVARKKKEEEKEPKKEAMGWTLLDWAGLGEGGGNFFFLGQPPLEPPQFSQFLRVFDTFFSFG